VYNTVHAEPNYVSRGQYHMHAFVSSVTQCGLEPRAKQGFWGSGSVCISAPRRPSAAARRVLPGLHMGHQTRAQKEAIVQSLREQLRKAEAVVALPLEGLKHQQLERLKSSLPATVHCKVIKNSYFQKAANGVTWLQSTSKEGEDALLAKPLLKLANFWFLAENLDDLPAAIRAYEAVIEELKLEQTNKIRGGVLEGQLYDGDSMARVGKIPTKQELYRDIAIVMRMVPTRLARALKILPTNVARAVRLAKVDVDAAAS
jgi:large subunit ribosomal protein L10